MLVGFYLADISLPKGLGPSITTPAGEARVHRAPDHCGLLGSGELRSNLPGVENEAEHQDEEWVQEIEVVVEEDCSLAPRQKNWFGKKSKWGARNVERENYMIIGTDHVSPPGQEVRPTMSQSRAAGRTNRQTSKSLVTI